uniref:Uncharacterized protein n=1 Tax=Eutreptiella gymnastica TaxID=73025 RepID=A0A6U7UMQ9_9EUGL|mmetsp:Transcript_125239/g.217055  ORF Transcript_125239/g.217055 Transcript_125239/m.217055 type:complete len:325 (+) Transcript_125239:60-1034(+)
MLLDVEDLLEALATVEDPPTQREVVLPTVPSADYSSCQHTPGESDSSSIFMFHDGEDGTVVQEPGQLPLSHASSPRKSEPDETPLEVLCRLIAECTQCATTQVHLMLTVLQSLGWWVHLQQEAKIPHPFILAFHPMDHFQADPVVIDFQFMDLFTVVRPTARFSKCLAQRDPWFVGSRAMLQTTVSQCATQAIESLQEQNMAVPPWRKPDYLCKAWSLAIQCSSQQAVPIPSPPDTYWAIMPLIQQRLEQHVDLLSSLWVSHPQTGICPISSDGYFEKAAPGAEGCFWSLLTEQINNRQAALVSSPTGGHLPWKFQRPCRLSFE